jgi:group I intron endonuclease
MKPNPILKKRPLIYCILNNVTGKVYVGKTTCIWKRCHSYLSDLRHNNKGNRINEYLFASMMKHGADAFDMFPLEFVDVENLAERELWWMHKLNSLDRHKGYNLRSDSSTTMIAHEDTRKKISDRLKKEWDSGIRDNHSAKLKASWSTRDRVSQSKLLSKTLTKYSYVVTFPNGVRLSKNYSGLKDLGLQNVIAKFHKKNSNCESFKNCIVERVLINEGETQGCISV